MPLWDEPAAGRQDGARAGWTGSGTERGAERMTGAVPDDLIDITTADALEEKKKLLKHLGRFDMLFFLVCTLVGLDTIGAAASNGAQAFTWLLFLAVLFFLPYALT